MEAEPGAAAEAGPEELEAAAAAAAAAKFKTPGPAPKREAVEGDADEGDDRISVEKVKGQLSFNQ